MNVTTRQRRILFFREHAGYVVGRRIQCAALADAENLAEEAECTYEWGFDNICDDSFVETWPEKDQEAWHAVEHECLVCVMYSPDGEHLASLCGIFDPDSSYRRVIEAELASEVTDALTTVGEGI